MHTLPHPVCKIIPLPPRRVVGNKLVRWHEAAESITASNLRILSAWQRVWLRTWWGL